MATSINKPKQKIRGAKRDANAEMIHVPLVDPRKIVLELDHIDKSKLQEEAEKKKQDQLFSRAQKQETKEYGVTDQIEIVRRQLVLGELGIEIPTDQKGDLDVAKLFDIKIKMEKDQDLDDKNRLAHKEGVRVKDDPLSKV
jgi:hypothetical protein